MTALYLWSTIEIYGADRGDRRVAGARMGVAIGPGQRRSAPCSACDREERAPGPGRLTGGSSRRFAAVVPKTEGVKEEAIRRFKAGLWRSAAGDPSIHVDDRGRPATLNSGANRFVPRSSANPKSHVGDRRGELQAFSHIWGCAPISAVLSRATVSWCVSQSEPWGPISPRSGLLFRQPYGMLGLAAPSPQEPTNKKPGYSPPGKGFSPHRETAISQRRASSRTFERRP